MAIYWLLALLAAFWQGVDNWLFWPLAVVLWAASRVDNARGVYALGLVTGLLTDLLIGQRLGQSAIFILISSGLVYWYRLRGRVPLIVLWLFILVLSFVKRWLWG